MKFEVPQNNFMPHPAGMFTGGIISVTDQGERESTFDGRTKMVHKISIDVRSDTEVTESGEPVVHREFCALSSDRRSTLVKLRQPLLGRQLNSEEAASFDADNEMVGRRVNYVIEHTYRNGKAYANIASWSLIVDDGRATEDDLAF